MYWPKHLASGPVSIFSPATSHVGRVTSCSPAFSAASLIAVGFMSGVPVICWRFSSVVTWLCPHTASAITAMPKPIKTIPETTPPIRNS
jgi:hypothetical protein